MFSVMNGVQADEVYEVIRLVRPLFRHLLKAVEDKLVGTGVSVPMRGVLERLYDHGPQSVPQIARALLIQRQFTQVTLNALVEQGWVETLPNRAHKRSPLFALSSEGRSTFEAVKARELALIAQIAPALSSADIQACTRVMNVLTQHFGEIAEGEQAEEGVQ